MTRGRQRPRVRCVNKPMFTTALPFEGKVKLSLALHHFCISIFDTMASAIELIVLTNLSTRISAVMLFAVIHSRIPTNIAWSLAAAIRLHEIAAAGVQGRSVGVHRRSVFFVGVIIGA